MSKLGPLQQSMAALFTPESERLRASKTEKGPSIPRLPTQGKLQESSKSGDSLGNPASPGYDGPLQRKKEAEEAHNESILAESKATESYSVPGSSSKKRIRLQGGWEKLLIAQKKLCEKARDIFTAMEAPEKYRRKGGRLQEKSRGSIVDLDIEVLRQAEEEKKKSDKDAA